MLVSGFFDSAFWAPLRGFSRDDPCCFGHWGRPAEGGGLEGRVERGDGAKKANKGVDVISPAAFSDGTMTVVRALPCVPLPRGFTPSTASAVY